MGKLRDRTFTGCWRCRGMKVKCDEALPSCNACRRLSLECPGYGAVYVWVEDNGAHAAAPVGGRRHLPCDATWRGFSVLPSDLVDHLISRCDIASQTTNPTMLMVSKRGHNPFSVFRAKLTPSLSPSPHLIPVANDRERYLFNHYLNSIAPLMVPYEQLKSPWLSLYPLVALDLLAGNRNSLFHSLLAHAAFHIAELHREQREWGLMEEIGLEYYDSAIKGLLAELTSDHPPAPATLALILSLMYTEVYRGSSLNWYQHYRGAWSLILNSSMLHGCEAEPLYQAGLSSLCIAKVVADTCGSAREANATNGAITETIARSLITEDPSFGCTIGTNPQLLQCIARISAYREVRGSDAARKGEKFVSEIRSILNLQEQLVQSSSVLGAKSSLHKAFVCATFIYLYRTVHGVEPCVVQPYVSEAFRHAADFQAASDGNLSFWPAFVAAAEAYEDADLSAARRWLEGAVTLGFGNRNSAKSVLEEVWRQRAKIAMDRGLQPGSVVVDWRTVMRGLGHDVLLV